MPQCELLYPDNAISAIINLMHEPRDFFKINAEVLSSLTPDKGHEAIGTFVTVTDGQTDLQKRRIDLQDQVSKLKGLLEHKIASHLNLGMFINSLLLMVSSNLNSTKDAHKALSL